VDVERATNRSVRHIHTGLINLFNPERVVLGGLLPRIRESARRHALRPPFEQASIGLGQPGVDAVALGRPPCRSRRCSRRVALAAVTTFGINNVVKNCRLDADATAA